MNKLARQEKEVGWKDILSGNIFEVVIKNQNMANGPPHAPGPNHQTIVYNIIRIFSNNF
jgi:hypothetical protein